MKFNFFKENNKWVLTLTDKNEAVVDIYKFDEKMSTDHVLDVVRLLTKAEGLQVNVDFTNRKEGN